jgi:hypothetical protein
MAQLSTHSYFKNNTEEFISTPIKLSSSLHQYSTISAHNAHETPLRLTLPMHHGKDIKVLLIYPLIYIMSAVFLCALCKEMERKLLG